MAVSSLCWQRSKPVIVNESTCTAETALLGCAVEDSVLMPDPLPSMTSSSLSLSTAISGSCITGRSSPAEISSLTNSSVSVSSTLSLSSSEETPYRLIHFWPGGTLARLHAPRSTYNFKDDMEVFSPLADVQPITPSLDKMWDDHNGTKKENLLTDKKPSSLLFPSSRRFAFVDGASDLPILDWKSSSMSRQDDTRSFPALGSTPPPSSKSEEASITPPEAWEGEMISDEVTHHRHLPSRFGVQASSETMPLQIRRLHWDFLNTSPPVLCLLCLRVASPKTKKTGAETREELLNSLSSWSESLAAVESGTLPTMNGGIQQSQKASQPDPQQGSNFTLQLFQRTLEETLDSFQKSIHGDMRNLHIEILRQFHMQEMEMSRVMSSILENQAELMEEVKSLRKENRQLRQLL
ncbi:hypothetical protein PTKIN_Ptkin16aG0518900 [Pterospermum kingtungense]